MHTLRERSCAFLSQMHNFSSGRNRMYLPCKTITLVFHDENFFSRIQMSGDRIAFSWQDYVKTFFIYKQQYDLHFISLLTAILYLCRLLS